MFKYANIELVPTTDLSNHLKFSSAEAGCYTKLWVFYMCECMRALKDIELKSKTSKEVRSFSKRYVLTANALASISKTLPIPVFRSLSRNCLVTGTARSPSHENGSTRGQGHFRD